MTSYVERVISIKQKYDNPSVKELFDDTDSLNQALWDELLDLAADELLDLTADEPSCLRSAGR